MIDAAVAGHPVVMRALLLGCLIACGGGAAGSPLDADPDGAPVSDAMADGAPVPDAPRDAVADAQPDAAPGCVWETSTVATSQQPTKVLLAVAPDGRVDVVFHDRARCGSLRHASKAPGAATWSDQVLDDNLGSEAQIDAMTGDAHGDLHAVYYTGPETFPGCDGEGARVTYAVATGGAWGKTMLSIGRVIVTFAIDVRDGETHIAYLDPLNTLGYAHGTFGNMSAEVVAPGDHSGTAPSLRVDAAGVVHATSLRFAGNTPSDALLYVERSTAGAWSAPVTLDTGPGVGSTSNVEVDAAGGVHVVYWSGSDLQLGYAYRPPGGSWSRRRLDTDGVSPHQTIRVDHAGALHVIYAGGQPQRVHHATASIGGAWTVEPAGEDTGVFGTAFALGPNDELHVAYAQGELVRYAHRVCH